MDPLETCQKSLSATYAYCTIKLVPEFGHCVTETFQLTESWKLRESQIPSTLP